MDKTECKSEEFSSRFIGLLLLPVALFLGAIGVLIVPVFGIFFALPLLVLSGVFIAAPRSRVCQILLNRG